MMIVLLALAGFALWRYWSLQPHSKPGEIQASGTIEATETLIAPKVGGRILQLAVDEGSAVQPGDLIAQLDTDELRPQVASAEAAQRRTSAQWDASRHGNRPEQIAQAKAQLAQAHATTAGAYASLLDTREQFRKVTDLKSQVDAARSHLDAMVAARTQAAEALRLAHAGTRTQEIDEATAQVGQAKVGVDHAASDFTKYDSLFNQQAISRQQWETARDTLNTAREQMSQAQAHLADLKAGPRPEEIREAEMALAQADANVDGARLALQNARVTYEDRLDSKSRLDAAVASYQAAQATERAFDAQYHLMLAGTREEDLRAAQQALQQARAQRQLAHAQLTDARVTAPSSGVIDTKIAEQGEVVAAGSPIVSMYDLDHVWVRVYVPEDRYGQVKIGQQVRVSVDSYHGAVFHGTVTEIASDAEFTPKNVQTEEERAKLVYGIKVNLDNRDHRLKPGMPADATILTR
jgi:multidrug resistance efflux pump